MLGLIKKDFLIVKNNLKLIIIMLMMFFIMALQGEFDITFVLPFIVVMLFISTFSYDEFNKWDAYAITLPNGRKNIVKSKYIASLILVIGAIIVTFLLNYFVGLINNNLEFDKIISSVLAIATGAIFIEAVMYPLIFKYGIEKGRIGLFALTIAIVVIVTLITKISKLSIPANIIIFLNNYYFIIIPIILTIILLLSYKISEKIFLKKEF